MIGHRWRAIIGVAVFLAVIAYLAGHWLVSLGILAATPVSLLNYWLLFSATRQSVSGTGAAAVTLLLQRMLYRLVLSLTVLLVAFLLGGVEVLLGALIALVGETFVYIGDFAKQRRVK